MNRESAIQILHNALQPDGDVRTEAEKTIKSLIQNNFQDFLTVFIQIMLDSSVPFANRHICSIIIKNSLHSKTPRIEKGYESNWLGCSFDFRTELIKLLESNLNLQEKPVFLNLTKIFGSILRIELANNTGRSFFQNLFTLVQSTEYSVGVLESIAYACDQIYEETMYIFSRDDKRLVYSIGMYYFETPQNDRQISVSTLRCILSSIEIYEDILVDEDTRTAFLYRLFNCNKDDQEILELSLEVLNRFVDVYSTIQDTDCLIICQFYNSFFGYQLESMPPQLFDFWQLLIEQEKYSCIQKSLAVLIPNLLSCIHKESMDDTEWNSHKAACSLLTTMNETMKILLITQNVCQSFIVSHLQSQDPEQRAIAETLIGCIAGPGASEFLYNTLSILLSDLNDSTTANESLFALAKICEKDVSCTINFLPTIVEKCGIIVGNQGEASTNAIWVYHAILISLREGIVKEVESVILYHYSNILSVLIRKLDQSLPEEYALRNALNTTLSELIISCPTTHRSLLDQLENYLYGKIFTTIEIIKSIDRNQVLLMDDVLSSYIILLESNLEMKKTFDVTNLCNAFVECLLLPEMLVRGEVYIAMSKLLSHFSVYLKKFIALILRDLSSREMFVLKASINLLSDCATFLESNFLEFTPAVIPALINAISSPEVPLELKPVVIVALGDIALAIGRSFEPYLSLSILLFSRINTLNRNGDEDYVDNLRRSVLKLFSCILVAIGSSTEIRKASEEIINNLKIAVYEDKEYVYTKEALDILSDIQSTLGSKCISMPWVDEYLKTVIRDSSGKHVLKAKELFELLY